MKRPLALDHELKVTISSLFGKITEQNACDVVDHVLAENEELRNYIVELEEELDFFMGASDVDE